MGTGKRNGILFLFYCADVDKDIDNRLQQFEKRYNERIKGYVHYV